MSKRIAINGFGRIGRQVTRILESDPEVDLVAINDLTDAPTLAHLMKYDSIHRTFAGSVDVHEGAIRINGRSIRTTAGALLDAYDEAFGRVRAALGAGDDRRFDTGVQAFFRDAPPEIAALFRGVEADPEGHLSPAALFANLQAVPVADRLQRLQRGLDDYLRFLLFVARETLPYTEVERLAVEVRALVHSVGAQG